MKEEWREIRGFQRYSVSNLGQIRHEARKRVLALYKNQSGVVIVGLMRGHRQCKRSVPLLVAKAFIPNTLEAFDTPINLNGDRFDNTVPNLIWRPRWFAIQYNNQFTQPYAFPIDVPIRDIRTGATYPNSFTCVTINGLLESDLVNSIFNKTYAWPTYQIFEVP